MSYLLSSILYSRRTFPYYTFNILIGLDINGNGACYKYDAVGSFEKVKATCSGAGESMIQPSLDELTDLERDDSLWNFIPSEDTFDSPSPKYINSHNDYDSDSDILSNKDIVHMNVSVNDALMLLKECYHAACEREITVGDSLEVLVLEAIYDHHHDHDENDDSSSSSSSSSSSGSSSSSSSSTIRERNFKRRVTIHRFPLPKH